MTDALGAVITNARVHTISSNEDERSAMTDGEGRYVILRLAPGSYRVRIEAMNFAVYEATIEITAGRAREMDAQLIVEIERQEINVGAGNNLSTDTEANASALRLREQDLEALPEDPEELAAALRALAGAQIGPDGGQILIDGFLNTGEPIPPRSSIREVRINQNPFSAENDRLGFGQIQIITRPGTENLRGAAFFNLSDESLNARNPFLIARPPYQLRNFGGTLTRRIIPRRASVFFTFDHRATDDNAIINALVLDENLSPAPFVQSVLVPRRQLNASARFDIQLNDAHTLTIRYNFYRNRAENAGVGGIFLPERAFSFALPIHTFQLTETAVISSRVVNEFRLQYIAEDRIDEPVSLAPAINVIGAFASGGSNAGRASNPEGRLIAQDSVLWTAGRHTLRAGARLRRTTITDISPDDFNGTFTFAGGLAPALDAAGNILRDASGQITFAPITSLERFRRTLLFGRQGFSPAEIRARGGGATDLIIGGGSPRATARQIDFGAYFQDDFRVRRNLTVSFGARYEVQTNINTNFNLAPRISLVWSPDFTGDARQPQTIVRGGFGVFFDRFNENQVLITNKSAAGDSFRLEITDPAILDSFPIAPSIETLRDFYATNQIAFRLAGNLREPYMLQAALGVERRLPFNTTVTATFIASRTLHALRTRNVNAPVIVRDSSGAILSRARPLGEVGQIFQYESSGRLNQQQLFVTLNNRLNPRVSFYANYTLGRARGDTEGFTFAADSYDLRSEYGRSSFDARHTFAAGGVLDTLFGVRVAPLVFASSRRPFNITTGIDRNEDSIFADRPAFASDLTRPSVRLTPFGAFDLAPLPGQITIPRNYGRAPGYFVVNLNINRTFALSRNSRTTGRQTSASDEASYRLTLGVRVVNLFNRVNLDSPAGNLSSPFFGRSLSTAGGFGAGSIGNPAAGNRRLEAQIRFEF